MSVRVYCNCNNIRCNYRVRLSYSILRIRRGISNFTLRSGCCCIHIGSIVVIANSHFFVSVLILSIIVIGWTLRIRVINPEGILFVVS
jgi:hypothetical protein